MKTIRLVISSFILLSMAIFTIPAHARTFSIQELNQMRAEVRLPMLTGDPQIDVPYLYRECANGIQFSCTFLPPRLREQLLLQSQQRRLLPPIRPYPSTEEGIRPLPPLGESSGNLGQPPYQGSILPLPPIDAGPGAWEKYERETQRRKNFEDAEQRRQKQQDKARQQRDDAEQKRQQQKIDRFFH